MDESQGREWASLRKGIYRNRWQYHPPWSVTRPWSPRCFRASDEFCNPSVYVQMPLIGGVVVFWKSGPLRVEADGPCAECLAEDERDRAAGWTVVR